MCWHKIRSDDEKEPKCPNCRKLYGDEPYQFSPLSALQEEKLKNLTLRPSKRKELEIYQIINLN